MVTVISADIFEASNRYAVDGSTTFDDYILNAGVTVSNTAGTGFGLIEDEDVTINGIVTARDSGIDVDTFGGVYGGAIRVGAAGIVFGEKFGISVGGVLGESITNNGFIKGGSAGISIFGNYMSVVNRGTIESLDGAALSTWGSINVNNLGIIKSNHYAYSGGFSYDSVTNSGRIYGTVTLGGGNDKFVSTNGYLYGTVSGGDGNDYLSGGRTPDVLRGDTGADRLFGNVGNDKLYGMLGNDSLSGGVGNDLLSGAQGIDSLSGGAGADNFLFNVRLTGANRDIVKDFSHSQHDHIQLENAVFHGLRVGHLAASAFHVGAAAHDANDHIIYNRANGALYYDRDGTGGAHQVQIATIANHALLHASDFLIV